MQYGKTSAFVTFLWLLPKVQANVCPTFFLVCPTKMATCVGPFVKSKIIICSNDNLELRKG